MDWFKHDSDAHMDAKLRKLRIKYGMEGYGLYWYCLELIAKDVKATNITFELEHDSEIISFDTGINYKVVEEMITYMVDLQLFENSGGIITCMKMAKRLDQSMTGNQKMRGMIAQIKKSHDPVMTDHDGVMISHDSVMQEEKRREEKRINTSSPKGEPEGFESFWNAYPRKVGKGDCRKRWKKIKPSKELQAKIIWAVQQQKKSDQWQKDQGQFVPLPATWLNQERWDDEMTDPSLSAGGLEI